MSHIKQTSDQVASFTLEVIDTNGTENSNQSLTLGNDTEKINVICHPVNVEVRQGNPATINCNVNNNGYTDIVLVPHIIGIEETGIQYTINGHESIETIPLSANSSKTFEVEMQASDVDENDLGKSYGYTIRLNCLDSIDCY